MKTFEEIKKLPNFHIIEGYEDGGAGEIYRAGKFWASVIWSTGGGWDHVSIAPYKHRYTPSWDEMCSLKDMFFREDEVVVQYHPAKSEYVNNIPNCLHLWKPQNQEMPTPPSVFVGLKKGQTMRDAIEEAKKVL